MLTIGIMPPIGVNRSCIAFTAPQEASVVITLLERGVPRCRKRTSFPSMVPQVDHRGSNVDAARLFHQCHAGLGPVVRSPPMNRANMAAHRRPWRVLRVICQQIHQRRRDRPVDAID
jgi:hypothetical protein